MSVPERWPTGSNTATTGATTRAEQLWPYDGECDFDRMTASGWSPSPLAEFVLKIQTRCNLNCDYCYVYNMGDESWKDQPHSMTLAVADQLCRRIAEHAEAHKLPSVLLSLHGGEPLLRGLQPLQELVELVRARLDHLNLEISMQTNATLVDAEVADGLASLGIRVGVSLDGTDDANGHRLDIHGRRTDERTLAGIRELAAHDGLFNGILCVIDLRNDPVEVFRTLVETGAPSIDFLVPHGSWMKRPLGKRSTRKGDLSAPAPYGEWLVSAFDEWFGWTGRRVKVRIFEDIVHLLLGGEASYEVLGLGPATLVTVEADGALELVDHIGVAYDGAEHTGLSVFNSSFDDVLRHPGVACRQIGVEALVSQCRECDFAKVCGAGLISHRFDTSGGFLNPTVYCSDMYHLIGHIQRELQNRIGALAARPA